MCFNILHMKTIIYVCHGNICRSVAAKLITEYLLDKYQMTNRFIVKSRATSLEEIGNDIYPPMKRALIQHGVPLKSHKAAQITKQDYEEADYIFYMDSNNLNYLNYLLNDTKKKFHLISEFTPHIHYIDDPWYSGEYEIVINELWHCIEDIIKKINRSL